MHDDVNPVPRVQVTVAAAEVLARLHAEHGPLMFHQSGGCCDGSAPMCYPAGEFRVGSSDVLLGQVLETPFWMAEDQFRYWEHCQLTIDVVPGRGASFSLEIPLGVRFVVRSRLFTEAEQSRLAPLGSAVW